MPIGPKTKMNSRKKDISDVGRKTKWLHIIAAQLEFAKKADREP